MRVTKILHSRKIKVAIALLLLLVIIFGGMSYRNERRLDPLRDEPKILIYEMYPSSWPGGLPAMEDHLRRHVAQLNVDYVWLAPCYPSGGTDGGYDITDFMAIDPAYGTLVDFDHFVETAESLDIKVVMDLVPNHTSDQHPWFQKSVQGEAPYDDYYLWSDEDLGWGTMFDGSSAFEWNEERGRYYCHIYHKTQPDLNWSNPKVVKEFQQIIDFWTLEHGVQGFRVDSVQLIGKKFSSTILPRDRLGTVAGLLKYYQVSDTPKILHQLFDGRGLFTFGEMTALHKTMFNKMVAPDGPLTAGLNLTASNAYDKRFGFIDASDSLKRLEKTLQRWAKHPSLVAMLESHDVPRFTSRAGITGEEALDLLFGSNARIICLYQGQELGLTNPELSDDISEHRDIQTIMRYQQAVASGEDPQAVLARLKPESRDNARVPLDLTEYDRQANDPESCLHHAIDLIKTWKGE